MITPRTSYLTRVFDQLVTQSRRDGGIRRSQLRGGLELVVQVAHGQITMTVKRPRVKVGAKELSTLRLHCGVPADADVLTPPDQGIRDLDLRWYYVTYRWRDDETGTDNRV